MGNVELVDGIELELSNRQNARRLGFKSAAPIRRLAASGAIQVARVNGRYRFAWSQIVNAINAAE